MRKFFLIGMLLVVGMTVSAQWSSSFQIKEVTSDTLTDTGTVYADFGKLTKPWDYVLFATADKVSGTVTGSIILQVSPDGSSWITHPTADTLTYTTASDAMLPSVLSGTDLVYPYMRAAVTGTGSSVSVWTLNLILKE